MADASVTPTAWDEDGKPVAPTQQQTAATAWDENGNPVDAKSHQTPPAEQQHFPVSEFGHAAVSDVTDMAKGALDMASAPAMHLKNAIQSLGQGHLQDAANYFIKSLTSDPAIQIVDAQLKSSGQAAERAVEAAKAGDHLAMAQHAAGIIPGASQVDAAMTNYQKDRSVANLAHVFTTAVPVLLPGGMRAAKGFSSEAGAAEGAAESAGGEAAEAPAKPGVVKQVMQGEKVAQAPAQAAVKSATGGSGSLRTMLDEPIDSLDSQAKDLYKQYDEASGVDLKGLNDKLAKTERQIENATTPEEESHLELKRKNIMDTLDQAEQDIKQKGLDPKGFKDANDLFRKARAGEDIDKIIQKHVKGNSAKGAPETVEVDGLIQDLEKQEKYQKFGNRAEQFMGKQNADKLLQQLYDAQKAGQKAVKLQGIAKKAGIALGVTGIGTEILHKVIE